jgi:hypothetical protein
MCCFNFETENGNIGTLEKSENYIINGFCRSLPHPIRIFMQPSHSPYMPDVREFTVLSSVV